MGSVSLGRRPIKRGPLTVLMPRMRIVAPPHPPPRQLCGGKDHLAADCTAPKRPGGRPTSAPAIRLSGGGAGKKTVFASGDDEDDFEIAAEEGGGGRLSAGKKRKQAFLGVPGAPAAEAPAAAGVPKVKVKKTKVVTF